MAIRLALNRRRPRYREEPLVCLSFLVIQDTSMDIRSMLASHPNRKGQDVQSLADSIEALLQCAATCTSCADACLNEENSDSLRRCIQLNLDCAEICNATWQLLSRKNSERVSTLVSQLETCRDICAECAAECEQHAEMHEHCRLCAEACRACEERCTSLLTSFFAPQEA